MLRTLALVATFASCIATSLPAQATPPGRTAASAAIDRELWAAVSTAVARGDIAALAKTYHPEAVLVDDKTTSPISAAIDGWGKGMEDNRKANRTATVAFRFASRQDDAATAFERGIFKYTTTEKGKPANTVYVNFEALVVRAGGTWRTLMERQLGQTTLEAWNKLPQ